MDTSDIKIYLSGGAANSNPLNSIGGIISSTEAFTQNFTASGVTGVTIEDVGGLVEGDVQLFTKHNPSGELEAFFMNAKGGYGPYQFAHESGQYYLYTWDGKGYGYMLVDFDLSTMPVSSSWNSETITITDNVNNIFDDVTVGEAYSGAQQFRCVYVKNTHSTDSVIDLGAYLQKQTQGDDVISIAIDATAGVGNGSSTGVAVTLDDEDDSGGDLAGYTFTNTEDPGSALELGEELAPGETIPIWIRRYVPAEIEVEHIKNTFGLGFKLFVSG